MKGKTMLGESVAGFISRAAALAEPIASLYPRAAVVSLRSRCRILFAISKNIPVIERSWIFQVLDVHRAASRVLVAGTRSFLDQNFPLNRLARVPSIALNFAITAGSTVCASDDTTEDRPQCLALRTCTHNCSPVVVTHIALTVRI